MHIPAGFSFSGVACGLKKSGKTDLGLILGDDALEAECYFTSNAFKAAPLLLSVETLHGSGSRIRAIVVNSGNANCATGEDGIADARRVCEAAAGELGIEPSLVHSSSTGIIGKRLDVAKITGAVTRLIAAAGTSEAHLKDFSAAIMTTDTFEKIVSRQVTIGGRTVTVCGVAKGAGMIQPDLNHATMLSYIMTDAAVAAPLWRKMTGRCVERSFNTITIDGCTSTNDSVFFLASGKSGVAIDAEDDRYAAFSQALTAVAEELSALIVKDGEGATKTIRVTITGAATEAEAKKAAFAVSNSMLFKTAMYGNNPNIGRVVQILGQEGFVDSSWKPAIDLKGLNTSNVELTVDIARGDASFTALTCDLTEDYVKINAEYN